MHEVNYNYVWIFLIAGILLFGAMLYFAAKFISLLDKTADRNRQKGRQTV